MKKIIIYTILIFISLSVFSQNIKLYGLIKNELGETVPGALIRVLETNALATSDPNGYYEIKIPSGTNLHVVYSSTGISKDTVFIDILNKSQKMDHVFSKVEIIVDPVYVGYKNSIIENIERINPLNLSVMPDISGNAVETLIKSMGATSNNELTSQYNVRGGNFDENLVYINDIEVYRPFLVRSGQQEGMSIINSDLVNNVKFSAGGFGAEYADKMSSVLDISYKTPLKFGGSVNIGLISQRMSLETVSKNKKLSSILGFRYKRSDYVLKALQIKGAYKPVFGDFQTFNTYKLNNKFDVSFLGNFTSNVYNFVPELSDIVFGAQMTQLSLNVAYAGQEKDAYNTYLGSLTFSFHPNDNWNLKFISSAYYSDESETFDIYSQYSLKDYKNSLDTASVKDSAVVWGTGANLIHARNYLNVFIKNFALKNALNLGNHFILSGLTFSNNYFNDIISEWEFVDSAGYSITPYHQRDSNTIPIYKIIKGNNNLYINQMSFYIEDKFRIKAGYTDLNFIAGFRMNYNDYNHQLLVSPRFSMLITPKWENEWYFRISTGYYYQPPFYREMRDFNGKLIENQNAQRSIHFIVGAYSTFRLWNRPFKFTSEMYYKKLDNLIPYEIDNLRIQYYANQHSYGYAAGADFKIYGEFVKGTDSWISVSFLKTMEDVIKDSYIVYYDKDTNRVFDKHLAVDSITVYPKYIPRPSDQFFNLGIFFQDYFPGNENIKVTLAYYFTSPFPFGPPQTERYRDTLRSKPYIRGDLSFLFLLKNPKKHYNNFFDNFSSIWLEVDVFNYMGILNRSAYQWLDLVPNTTSSEKIMDIDKIAVPQSLTGRLLNVNLKFNF